MTPAPLKPELRALTGLRILAAGWVVVTHFVNREGVLFPWLQPVELGMKQGHLGVDLFFMLSGFILAYTYLDRLDSPPGGRSGGAWSFLQNRVARVYPVHFVTLHLALILWFIAQQMGIQVDSLVVSPGLYLQNLLMIHSWWHQPHSFNYPAWSISAEWFAYLSFPVAAVVLVRVRSVWGAAVGYVLAVAAALGFTGGTSDGYPLAQIAGEFTAGVFAYLIWRRFPDAVAWRVVAPMSLLAVIVWSNFLPYHSTLPAPLFGLVIAGLAAGRGWFAQLLSRPAWVFGGQVSYSLYMTHALINVPLVRFFPPERLAELAWLLKVAFVTGYVAVVWIAAVAMFRLVEEPGRRLLRRSERPNAPSDAPHEIATR